MTGIYYRIRTYIFPVALLIFGGLFFVLVDKLETYEALYVRAQDSFVSAGESMGFIKKVPEPVEDVVPIKTEDIANIIDMADVQDKDAEIDTQVNEAQHGEQIEGLVDDEPVFMEVDDTYFEDAAFIGDSRVVGLYEYGGWDDIAHFYASVGLNIYKLFDVEMAQYDEEGHKYTVTLEEGLSGQKFKKIYIMLGINEVGTGTPEYFTDAYQKQLDRIMELQPDAIIYVMSIMKVSKERSDKGDHVNNEAIDERNEALSLLADNKRIFYLDVNPAVCDEDGNLTSDYTFDGVHLKAQYIALWQDFLRTHAYEVRDEE